MEGKLIFKFGDHLQISFDQSRFALGDLIKFGQGFEDVEILFQGPISSEVKTLESQPLFERVLEVNLPTKERSPLQNSRKRVAEVSPKASASQPFVFNRLTFPKVQKSSERQTTLTPVLPEKMAVERQHEVVQSLAVVSSYSKPEKLFKSSQYEEGTSSTYVLTKSQRRNKNKRLRKRLEKQEQAELEAELMKLSPLAEGSRFYPLFVSRSKEDVEKIVASPPRPLTKVPKSTPEERAKQWENDIRNIYQRVADKTCSTKEKVIKAMKNVICKHVDIILREDKDPKDSKLIVQPSQRDRQRTVSEQIVLVDSTAVPPKVHGRPMADYPNRQVVPRTSLSVSNRSDVPTRFRRSPKEDKPSSPLGELRSRGRIQTPPLDEVNVGCQKSHVSSSGVKEEWRPKVAAPSVVHSSPPSCVDSKDKGKAPMEINSYEEYYPSHINPSTGKTVEEMIEYLKDSIKKIDEDERREEEENHRKLIENFNPDEDDLMDEEDIFVIHYGIRGSSLSGDPHTNELLEVEEEGNENPHSCSTIATKSKRW
ncbi:hypothetical protein M5K25_019204 [Dendrobium thyrsiflorum]|uniref:Uncharacterized protein n=1 Tax=Dendrobium thyrsiflorum TaxID=117978 RepID=A0ABD0UL78_DENTH